MAEGVADAVPGVVVFVSDALVKLVCIADGGGFVVAVAVDGRGVATSLLAGLCAIGERCCNRKPATAGCSARTELPGSAGRGCKSLTAAAESEFARAWPFCAVARPV